MCFRYEIALVAVDAYSRRDGDVAKRGDLKPPTDSVSPSPRSAIRRTRDEGMGPKSRNDRKNVNMKQKSAFVPLTLCGKKDKETVWRGGMRTGVGRDGDKPRSPSRCKHDEMITASDMVMIACIQSQEAFPRPIWDFAL